MPSTKTTVDVDAEVYSHALPDWFTGDTVPVEVTAFEDKVYLDFPRFSKIEREARNYILDKDDTIRGTGEPFPINRGEIDSLDEAIEKRLAWIDMDTDEVPDETDQFCVDPTALFHATVQVSKRGRYPNESISIAPVRRELGVLATYNGNPSVEPHDQVSTSIDASEAHPTHLKLVEAFATTVAELEDDRYWLGYKTAANRFGDELYTLADIAWDKFDDEWSGDLSLMERVGEWLAETGVAVCRKSHCLFPIPEWTRPTGSYVATISDVYQGKCPFCGADKDENWECIKSFRSTRRANTYKCNSCGETKRGITTG